MPQAIKKKAVSFGPGKKTHKLRNGKKGSLFKVVLDSVSFTWNRLDAMHKSEP